MKPKGITRREAVALASGAVAAAAIPSAILSAASAALAQTTPIEPIEVDRLLRLVAHQQEPAWDLWQATAAEFAPLVPRAEELAACRDMDELLAFRLGEAVIAFDMASRRNARLALMTTWSEPRNEPERAIKDRAEACRASMNNAETYQVWMTLSRHIARLQKDGLRAKGHVYLRQQQERRQHEISRAFEREYGPKTMA
jgi:hypothetical protein